MKVITHGDEGDTTNTVPIETLVPKKAAGGIFAKTNNVVSNENGDYTNDNFCFGSPQLDSDGNVDHDTRMLFDKSTGFFGAGGCDGTQWGGANRGLKAAAFGHDCIASGTYSLAYGGYCLASGYQAIAGGWQSSAKGFHSVALGSSCEVSGGSDGVALGYRAVASSHGSVAIGTEARASSQRAVSLGNQAEAHMFGMYAFSSGSDILHGIGYNQHSRLVPYAVTTDATATVLDIFTALVLPASSMWGFKATVTALQLNGVAGAMFKIEGAIRRDNTNNTSLDYSNSTTLFDNIGTGGVVAQANDTLESLEIVVTGKASTSIRWVANIEITQSKHF